MGGGGRTSRELAGRGSASTGGEGSRDGAVPLAMVTRDGMGSVPQVEWGHLRIWAGGHCSVCLSCTSGYCPVLLSCISGNGTVLLSHSSGHCPVLSCTSGNYTIPLSCTSGHCLVPLSRFWE